MVTRDWNPEFWLLMGGPRVQEILMSTSDFSSLFVPDVLVGHSVTISVNE